MYYIIQTFFFFNPLQSNSNLFQRGHNLLLHISSIKPAPIVRSDSIIISVELSWSFVTVLPPHFSCHVSERKFFFFFTQNSKCFYAVLACDQFFLILSCNYFYFLMFVDSVFLHFSMTLFQFSGSVVQNVFLYCYYNYTTSSQVPGQKQNKTEEQFRPVQRVNDVNTSK